MPEIEITDHLDKPVDSVKIDLAHPSSLVNYLKTEALHLAVFPDFLARKDTALTQAATKPISFEGKAQHGFQLGNLAPEIAITPGAKARIAVNASPGSNVFDDDLFRSPAVVPAQTGYVGVAFAGSLAVDVSAENGDLSFGFEKTSGVGLEYWRAFPLGAHEPKLGEALAETLSTFVIPGDLSDLDSLAIDDIAAVSGEGSLKVSGAISVTASPNPLASADLPLGAGAIAVKAGATAGLSADFTLSGSYQLRARRINSTTIELSFVQKRGTAFTADFSASAGVTAKVGDTDLLTPLLDAISTDPTRDKALFADLSVEEAKTLREAIKQGLDHRVQASVNEVLAASSEEQAVFQYEIQPARLSPAASTAVHRALDGDLRLITALEENAGADGIVAPGIRMLNSVLTETRKRGVTFRLNLLGVLNYTSLADFVRASEVLTDNVTGDVTIKQTVSGQRITALFNSQDRDEALRKAMFDSVLVTTVYRASRALLVPSFASEHVHFAVNQNTNAQIMGDYLTWFVTLNLLSIQERTDILEKFADGGSSSCVLRTAFDDGDCVRMFFDQEGRPRPDTDYFDLGRQALRALLDPTNQPIDKLRYRILDDALWPKAQAIGANSQLGDLVGLSRNDPRTTYLVGDLLTIIQWTNAMTAVASSVQDLRAFAGNADRDTLLDNNVFKQKRDALQKKLQAVVQKSTTKFHEPWGMVALYWAAGSPHTAHARISTSLLMIERRQQPAVSTA